MMVSLVSLVAMKFDVRVPCSVLHSNVLIMYILILFSVFIQCTGEIYSHIFPNLRLGV